MKNRIMLLILASLSLAGCSENKEPKKDDDVYYTFSFNGVNCSSLFENSYLKGTNVELTINPFKGYVLPETIEFTGGDYVYNKDSGSLTFTISDNTTVKCVAESSNSDFYYITKVFFDDFASEEWSITSEENKTKITHSITYVSVTDFVYENGVLVQKTEKYDDSYEYPVYRADYIYNDSLLVKEELFEDDVMTAYRTYTYDELNRKTNISLYENGELAHLITYSYPNSLETLEKDYFVENGENVLFEEETVIIDNESKTRTVTIKDADGNVLLIDVYDIITNNILESIDYSDGSKTIFIYNDNGDITGRDVFDFDEESNKWVPYRKVIVEYDENNVVKSVINNRYNSETQDYDFVEKKNYQSDENNVVTTCTYEYENGEITCTYTYEYDTTNLPFAIDILDLCELIGNYSINILYY